MGFTDSVLNLNKMDEQHQSYLEAKLKEEETGQKLQPFKAGEEVQKAKPTLQ